MVELEIVITLAEFERLHAEIKTERSWREELQALTIDLTVENEKLSDALRRIIALGDSAAKLAYIDEHDARIAINVAREALG